MAELRAASRIPLPIRVVIIAVASLLTGWSADRVLSSFGVARLGWAAAAIVAISLSEPLLDARKRIRVWQKGSVGEEKTETWLRKLPSDFVVLHDLAIPGSKANVDHVVIGPTGVFVVDSKNYRWKITENRAGELWSGKYPMAREIKTVNWEATKVATALGGVAVEAMLCIHGAEIPRRDLVKNGVKVVGPNGMMRTIQQAPVVTESAEAHRLAQLLMERMGRR